MRNRRAAQESRDRKKRQFEVLEEENRRLQSENAEMKRRIEKLEAQQREYDFIFDQSTIPPPSVEETPDEPIIKTEVFSPSDSFDATFHPAVMKYDRQCPPSICLMWISLLVLTRLIQWPMTALRQLYLTLFSSMMTKTWISLLTREKPAYLFPATFNSLNTGSLFTGAENRLCGFSSRLVRGENVKFNGKQVVDRLDCASRRIDWLLGEMYPIK
jgi:hypothetical protein